eukprot:gnl/TRDRNA2_/TRDRNA2_94095_c0_seq1.p1 gnl/TRDRNA2_/TRDRNA2_94095_c0~~gnl/TRDRNA2_/TRDRNA2_94095_c0_seq1.p1  ORF type:complete len:346 (-),score=79.00 gnl/TRDRNA2_/TRDRNA2_94095_c0_seq1:110-1147(-)
MEAALLQEAVPRTSHVRRICFQALLSFSIVCVVLLSGVHLSPTAYESVINMAHLHHHASQWSQGFEARQPPAASKLRGLHATLPGKDMEVTGDRFAYAWTLLPPLPTKRTAEEAGAKGSDTVVKTEQLPQIKDAADDARIRPDAAPPPDAARHLQDTWDNNEELSAAVSKQRATATSKQMVATSDTRWEDVDFVEATRENEATRQKIGTLKHQTVAMKESFETTVQRLKELENYFLDSTAATGPEQVVTSERRAQLNTAMQERRARLNTAMQRLKELESKFVKTAAATEPEQVVIAEPRARLNTALEKALDAAVHCESEDECNVVMYNFEKLSAAAKKEDKPPRP